MRIRPKGTAPASAAPPTTTHITTQVQARPIYTGCVPKPGRTGMVVVARTTLVALGFHNPNSPHSPCRCESFPTLKPWKYTQNHTFYAVASSMRRQYVAYRTYTCTEKRAQHRPLLRGQQHRVRGPNGSKPFHSRQSIDCCERIDGKRPDGRRERRANVIGYSAPPAGCGSQSFRQEVVTIDHTTHKKTPMCTSSREIRPVGLKLLE